MKHVKRKFLFEKEIPNAVENMRKSSNLFSGPELQTIKISENQRILLVTEDNRCITSFEYKKDGKRYFIPEPNPIVIYFNNAQTNLRYIKTLHPELMQSLNLNGNMITSKISHLLYNYFFHASGFSIFLFTAIEATINNIIPQQGYVYRITSKKKIEMYDYPRIQQMPFETKLKSVIPDVTKKKFALDHPEQYQHIINLKNFRDEIVHTKAFVSKKTPYSHLFSTSLDFNYDDALLAVRDFINYYIPDLIIECDCDQDF